MHDEIEGLLGDFSAAWDASDGEALAGLYVEDGCLIDPFGNEARGRSAIARAFGALFEGPLGATTTRFDIENIRPVESEHAFVDGRQVARDRDGNPAIEVHVAMLTRRTADGWRFVDGRPHVVAEMPGSP
jgi:uncharacterized protein (TIGR02246 family)